tara:strand:- start:86 stop:724 length:639 start_codon:yes stop_codon:yes gene_type:complete
MSEIAFKPDVQNQTVMVEVISPSASHIRRPKFQKKVEHLNFQYFISQIPYLSRDDTISMRDITRRELRALSKNGISEIVYTAEENAFTERRESKRKLIKFILPYIPPENKTMVFLKNCIVSELDKWMCEDQLPYLNGKNNYFGISNGEWVTDYLGKIDGYSSFEIIEWKSKWWLEKKRCGDFCYIDSVANMDAKTELTREYLKRFIREMNEK